MLEVRKSDNERRISSEENKAITPPSLAGTARRIQYAKRKYHSGTMCGGVTIGLAGMRFTGSRKYCGCMKIMNLKVVRNTLKPRASLILKKLEKATLSAAANTPKGLLDPEECKYQI